MGHLHSSAALLGVLCLAAGCENDEKPSTEAAPSRVNAVHTTAQKKATTVFCEKSFPGSGGEAKKWTPPPDRPLPPEVPNIESGRPKDDSRASAGNKWLWINVWASWCGPCVKEMPLLSRWKRSLEKEGVDLRFELWSVDEEEQNLVSAVRADMPGPIRWLRSQEDMNTLMEALQIAQDSALPVHALVDHHGMLRCVRVGAVEEHAYGYVRSILTH